MKKNLIIAFLSVALLGSMIWNLTPPVSADSADYQYSIWDDEEDGGQFVETKTFPSGLNRKQMIDYIWADTSVADKYVQIGQGSTGSTVPVSTCSMTFYENYYWHKNEIPANP